MNAPKDSTGGCCPPPPCYAVFVRKAGRWIQESVPFYSYAEAQSHAKLTRRARPFVEMTRVRRLPHNSTMKKLEKRIAVLESTIRALIPLAEMGTAHWQEPAKEIEKARKLIKP